MAPPGVEFFATRLPLVGGGADELYAMANQVEEAARLLAALEPSLILFHCTGASVVGGIGYDEQLSARIERATGRPAGATPSGIVLALQALGVQRVALVTPYTAATNAVEVAFLEAHGLRVVENVALGMEHGAEFVRLEPSDWYRVVRGANTAGAEGILVACTNVRVIEAIDWIEQDCRLPVVASNQASLWYVLRRLGVGDRVEGYGRLLRDCAELPVAAPAAG
jgi:maleate isomerase